MLSEGQVIGGKYRVTRQLARGGMGEVCLAVHEGPGGFARQVVIKTLLPELARREDLVQMFLGEAQLAAQLTHQNIVHVYDFGLEGQTYFFVMEYLQGATLSELLKRNRKTGRKVSSTFVCAVGSQACAGLAYAFSKPGPDGEPLRVVHRDVSPQNILVCEEGIAKILDFGIAKAQLGGAGRVEELKGKPSYLSPEQARGLPADSRSDVFSLGIVLWEALAGHKLFVGNGSVELADQVCSAPIPLLSALSPELPNDLSLAVARALERDPERRFQSAAEMGHALESLFQSLGGQSMQEELLFELRGESPLGAGAIAAPTARPSEPVTASLPEWMTQAAYADCPQSPAGAEAPLELDLARGSGARARDPAPVEAPRMAVRGERSPVSPASPARLGATPRPAARSVAAGAPKAAGSRAWIVGAGIGALLLIGAAVALLLPRGGSAPEPEPNAGAPTPEWIEELKTVEAAISSVPDGAAIWIDGSDSGKTTPAALKLDSGRDHTIALRHPDFLEHATTVFAAPKTPIKIEQVLTPGAHVSIESEPAGAEIEIDGKPAFKAPGRSEPLAKGKHVVWARLAGHIPEKRELELADAQPIHFALQLAPGAEVSVASVPEGAEILIDGKDSGLRTPAVAVVSTGAAHTVGVRKDGFVPQSRKLGRARAGARLSAEFTLEGAEQAALKARVASLEKELASWERRLEALSKRQSGVMVNRTASQELALEREVAAAEARIEDLSAELNEAREKLIELGGAQQP